jgi:hypothetical protein
VDSLLTVGQAFLSSEMMYSCALWDSAEGGIRGDLEPSLPSSPSSPSSSTGTLVSLSSSSCDDGALEGAQARKISHVLSALRLRPGMRLLEFGSGWGALAITAARDYDVEVDSLTLSIEQKQLADERIQAAGLEGRVRVHLMDYRHTPRDWDGCFDAFVSIEMLEVRFGLSSSSERHTEVTFTARRFRALQHLLRHCRPRPQAQERDRCHQQLDLSRSEIHDETVSFLLPLLQPSFDPVLPAAPRYPFYRLLVIVDCSCVFCSPDRPSSACFVMHMLAIGSSSQGTCFARSTPSSPSPFTFQPFFSPDVIVHPIFASHHLSCHSLS